MIVGCCRYYLFNQPPILTFAIIYEKVIDCCVDRFAYAMLRADVKTEKNEEPMEVFTMMFKKTASGAQLLITWEDVKVALPFTF